MRALPWMALATLLQPCLQGCARGAESPGTPAPTDAAAPTANFIGGGLDIPGAADYRPEDLPRTADGGTTPFVFHGDDAHWTPPRRHCAQELRPTPEALAQRVEGTIVAKCFITLEGTARHCRIIKHLPFMDAAAIDYLQRCSYSPITYWGKPMEADVAFTLRLRPPLADAGTPKP